MCLQLTHVWAELLILLISVRAQQAILQTGTGTLVMVRKSTLQNPARQYATASTFNVNLSIINAQGCVSDTASKPVIVSSVPNR